MAANEQELGRALRQWRDRISPATVGLPTNGQRRTAGLRREELALLAGVSVDYVTRLEQGRSTGPSAQVLAALARALRLTGQERDHLFRVAGQAPPDSGRIRRQLTPGVQRLLERMQDTPVAVSDAAWTLLASNQPWDALMGDHTAWRGRERNIAWRHFTGQPGRVRRTVEETAQFEAEMVADLHGAAGRYPRDEELGRLVADLSRLSARFAELWAEGTVAPHVLDHKVIDHPEVGVITLDCDVLTVQGADLRVVAYTAEPGSEAADKLALLRVIGIQSLRT